MLGVALLATGWLATTNWVGAGCSRRYADRLVSNTTRESRVIRRVVMIGWDGADGLLDPLL
jgi:hypothetical protein